MAGDWESAIIAAYRHQLVIALPLTILAIKILVRVIAREPKKDVFRSLLVLPLDFVYIAMGIFLAAAARRDSALVSRYGSDANLDMAVVIQMISLMASATVITVFDRWGRMLYQKFYAAWDIFGEKRKQAAAATTADAAEGSSGGQLSLALAATDGSTFSREFGILLLWILFYWMCMIPIFMGQVALGVLCLGSILGRLK